MLASKLVIRLAGDEETPLAAKIQRDAFGRDGEAELVRQLVAAPQRTLSILAECGGEAVGHVLVTQIGAPVRAAALAPLGVLPAYREMQVGSELVREAVRQAMKARYAALFVLGDNPFYERFGFSSALADPFEIDWQGPHFMALELKPGALAGKTGRLDYPQAFFSA
jgi:putative acetyltransferase